MRGYIRRNERGLSQVVIIVAVVVIAAIIGVGWKVASNSSNSPSKAANKTAASTPVDSACLKAYNDKTLCAFAAGFSLSGVPYKAVFSVTQGTAGSSSTTTYLSDGKGNSSISSVSAGGEADYITLAGTTYLKDQTDSTWWKFAPGSSSTPTTSNPTSGIKFDTSVAAGSTKPTVTYKKIDTEACGSQSCVKYQVIDPATPTTTEYVWFDTKDYRLQQFSSKDSSGSSNDAVFTYQNVTITAPTPTKDFSASSGVDSQALEQALQSSGQ